MTSSLEKYSLSDAMAGLKQSAKTVAKATMSFATGFALASVGIFIALPLAVTAMTLSGMAGFAGVSLLTGLFLKSSTALLNGAIGGLWAAAGTGYGAFRAMRALTGALLGNKGLSKKWAFIGAAAGVCAIPFLPAVRGFRQPDMEDFKPFDMPYDPFHRHEKEVWIRFAPDGAWNAASAFLHQACDAFTSAASAPAVKAVPSPDTADKKPGMTLAL